MYCTIPLRLLLKHKHIPNIKVEYALEKHEGDPALNMIKHRENDQNQIYQDQIKIKDMQWEEYVQFFHAHVHNICTIKTNSLLG